VLLAAFLAGPQRPAALAADSGGDLAQPFLGRWDMTLEAPERSYPSWLGIEQVDGALRVRMVGRWGHARWLPQAEVSGDRIRFVSPREEEGRTDGDMVFEGRRSGEDLVGSTTGPGGVAWPWRARRAPPLARARALSWGKPLRLFNGRDLDGWTPVEAGAGSWNVVDGALVSAGNGSDLRSTALFGDFRLHLEFLCAPGANSGVYLRGRYEVQIEDDPVPGVPDQRTGSVYGFLAPVVPVPRTPGVWQAYDITLIGRRVTVVLDGRTLIDGEEIPGITGGALDSREASPGPLLLQGSEAGEVRFRNIVITPALAE
jgi:hypothetical protein